VIKVSEIEASSKVFLLLEKFDNKSAFL